MAEINQEILDTLSSTLKDKKTNLGLDAKILEFFTGGGSFSSESSTGMDSASKVELAKGYFENAKMMFEFMKNDPGYQSVLQDIEKQIALYNKEIEAIDTELKLVEDEEKKKELLKEKKHFYEKAG